MPIGIVMAGFRRRERQRALARDLARLCVDAAPSQKLSLGHAARVCGVTPARAWRILEPILYARYHVKEQARVEAYLLQRQAKLHDCDCASETSLRSLPETIDARPS